MYKSVCVCVCLPNVCVSVQLYMFVCIILCVCMCVCASMYGGLTAPAKAGPEGVVGNEEVTVMAAWQPVAMRGQRGISPHGNIN